MGAQGREGGRWERARRWRGADRDVSAASVIWRRLAAARGPSGGRGGGGPRESVGMIERTTPTTLAGGPGSADKSKRGEVIFEKLQKSPWKLA